MSRLRAGWTADTTAQEKTPMAPRSKAQRAKASQYKQQQRDRMLSYGLTELTVYVPTAEVEGLRNRSKQLVAAARAKAAMDALGEGGLTAMNALVKKDFSMMPAPRSSGSDEPHKDHNPHSTSKSADTSPKTPQTAQQQARPKPPTPAATSAPAATQAPAPQTAPATRPSPIPQRPQAPHSSPTVPAAKSEAEMTAMLAKANGLATPPRG